MSGPGHPMPHGGARSSVGSVPRDDWCFTNAFRACLARDLCVLSMLVDPPRVVLRQIRRGSLKRFQQRRKPIAWQVPADGTSWNARAGALLRGGKSHSDEREPRSEHDRDARPVGVDARGAVPAVFLASPVGVHVPRALSGLMRSFSNTSASLCLSAILRYRTRMAQL